MIFIVLAQIADRLVAASLLKSRNLPQRPNSQQLPDPRSASAFCASDHGKLLILGLQHGYLSNTKRRIHPKSVATFLQISSDVIIILQSILCGASGMRLIPVLEASL